MRAEVISVGTELLLGDITNTNARYLSRRLAEMGIEVYYHITVGDNPNRLASVLAQALERSDMVITTGGLGPTVDDITRETVAGVLGVTLQLSEYVWSTIEEFFSQRGLTPTQNNRRQAMVIPGAVVLDNPRGTAPGQWVAKNGKYIILLPGPPREMVQMFENSVLPLIDPIREKTTIKSRILKICGMGESMVEERLADLMSSSNPSLAPYAEPGEVHLRITAKAPTLEAALEMISPVESEITERLGVAVFGRDDETLEEVIGRELTFGKMTLAVAESCTGGLLASRITDVPGSSRYFVGGVVAYTAQAKSDETGVREDLIDTYGVCSLPVARAMAEGIRRRLGASIAVSTTGVAGPDGGSSENPVGTVYIYVDTSWGSKHLKGLFQGNRTEVKRRATQAALTMIWKILKEKGGKAEKSK